MADRFTRFLMHPATQMAAGIMAGSDPQMQGLGGVGQGIMSAGNFATQQQAAQQQQRLFQQQQLEAQRRAQSQAAFGATLDPVTRLQYEADPQAYLQSMYQKPSDFLMKMGYAGGDPNRYRELFGPAETNLSVDLRDKQQNLGDQLKYDLSKQIGTNIIEGSQAAGEALNWADQGLEYLRHTNTGRWAPAITEASAWLGINPEQVGTAEAFISHTGEAAMQRIQQTKGSVSDAEMAYFQRLSPELRKTREGNYILLEIARRKAYRARDMARYIGEYANRHDGDLTGFEQWYLKNKDPFPKFNVRQLRRQFRRDILGDTTSPATEDALVGGGYVTPAQ